VENITSYIIVSIISFIAGFIVRLYLDRKADDAALQGVRQSRAVTEKLEVGNREMSGTVEHIKEGIKRAETATGKMEEELDRIEQGNKVINTAVERAERAASEAEEALGRAEGSVSSIRKILSQAKKKE
jgi:hypothetical protein